ncbi:MAG: DUF1440 domain-containing protein [Verrucomicrobiae bacterium]|nr:DUF1440 domain-containing protein [Verrucomicrobiae bacterium]
MNAVSRGLLAGFVATVPMTFWLKLLHGGSPHRKLDPLPPRQITMNVAEAAGVRERLDEEDRSSATLAAHFSFGAASGAAYSALERKWPGPAIAKGVAYGLAVWAAAYAVALPALHLQPAPQDRPRRRNALMISAHLIWGGALALGSELLRQESEPPARYLRRKRPRNSRRRPA